MTSPRLISPLDTFFLPEVLELLRRGKRTGVLTVSAPPWRGAVGFHGDKVVFARASTETADLVGLPALTVLSGLSWGTTEFFEEELDGQSLASTLEVYEFAQKTSPFASLLRLGDAYLVSAPEHEPSPLEGKTVAQAIAQKPLIALSYLRSLLSNDLLTLATKRLLRVYTVYGAKEARLAQEDFSSLVKVRGTWLPARVHPGLDGLLGLSPELQAKLNLKRGQTVEVFTEVKR